jgi:hypothetical protein
MQNTLHPAVSKIVLVGNFEAALLVLADLVDCDENTNKSIPEAARISSVHL